MLISWGLKSTPFHHWLPGRKTSTERGHSERMRQGHFQSHIVIKSAEAVLGKFLRDKAATRLSWVKDSSFFSVPKNKSEFFSVPQNSRTVKFAVNIKQPIGHPTDLYRQAVFHWRFKSLDLQIVSLKKWSYHSRDLYIMVTHCRSCKDT